MPSRLVAARANLIARSHLIRSPSWQRTPFRGGARSAANAQQDTGKGRYIHLDEVWKIVGESFPQSVVSNRMVAPRERISRCSAGRGTEGPRDRINIGLCRADTPIESSSTRAPSVVTCDVYRSASKLGRQAVKYSSKSPKDARKFRRYAQGGENGTALALACHVGRIKPIACRTSPEMLRKAHVFCGLQH